MSSPTLTIPKGLKLHPRFIVDEKGKKTEAVIPYREFVDMQDLLEDYFDILCAESRLDEEGVTLEELEKELKADGTL
jgi:hypothetical protein